jgi:hypothetical protein
MSTTITTQNFATYLRTRMFWRSRLRNVDDKEPIHVPKDQLKQVDLKALAAAGEIAISKKKTQKGHEAFYYAPLKLGPINPDLLPLRKSRELDKLTVEMRSYLTRVSLKEGSGSTDYFNVFLYLKNNYLHLFFTVDLFSGRVHTPVSGFHRAYRPNILIDGEQTASLDVTTMQPLLLGKILESHIGVNEYSQWINEGKDIYLSIQDKAKLENRDKAKKRFFEILFSYADKRLAAMFGNANWINWINDFKSRPMAENPHSLEKQHSNLAWLLQTTEVKIMQEVWQALIDAKIVFLSVHDEVIVKAKDEGRAKTIFSNILAKHFKYYKLNSKGEAPQISQIEEPKPKANTLSVPEETKPRAPQRMRTIEQFHSEAMRAFSKTLSKDKTKFLTCWAKDLKDILLDAGITPKDFLTYCGASA